MTEITMQTQDAPDEEDPQETRLREALDILISKEGQRKTAEILGVDRKSGVHGIQEEHAFRCSDGRRSRRERGDGDGTAPG